MNAGGRGGDCTVYVAKTKALISCAVTAQLICAFIFAYVKSGFLVTRLIFLPLHFEHTEMNKIHFRIKILSFFFSRVSIGCLR